MEDEPIESPEDDGNQENPNAAPPTRVLLDVFHAMKRVTSLVPAKHPMLMMFSNDLRDSIFTIDQSDKAKIEEACQRGLGDHKFKTNFTERFKSAPDWVLKRVRRRIPCPEQLVERLKKFQEKYTSKKFVDHKHGELFNARVKKELNHLITHHAAKGCLSDPPGMSFYAKSRTDSDGLQLYRCLRGTNTVELWHQFIEMRFGSWNAGPEFATAVMLMLADRRNKRASARNRKNFPNVGHYEHYLIDELQSLHKELFGKPKFTWWNNTNTIPVHNEEFGLVPTLGVQFQEIVTDEDVKYFPDSMKFMAKARKTKVLDLNICTREEKLIFMKAISYYIGKFDIMANDWNLGRLKLGNGDKNYILDYIQSDTLLPTGVNSIWKKRAHQLESYFNSYYLKALNRKIMLRDGNLQEGEEYEESLLTLEDLSLLELIEAEVIPLPFRVIMDAENEIIRRPDPNLDINPANHADYELEPDFNPNFESGDDLDRNDDLLDLDNGVGPEDADLEEIIAHPQTQDQPQVVTYANVSAHVGASSSSSFNALRDTMIASPVREVQIPRKRAPRQCIYCQKHVFHVLQKPMHYSNTLNRSNGAKEYLRSDLRANEYKHGKDECPFEGQMKGKRAISR